MYLQSCFKTKYWENLFFFPTNFLVFVSQKYYCTLHRQVFVMTSIGVARLTKLYYIGTDEGHGSLRSD